ncbi:ATP-dependent zinc protease [Thalassotalea maritima]|uniref:ATP-dependent zinc protease family protein n=1 Tax=Thalassotalea maritima TaxID=3242416 RepID=UPI0035276C6E
MFKYLSCALTSVLLSACLATNPPVDHSQQLNSMNNHLNEMEQNLVDHISRYCEQDEQQLVSDIVNAVKAAQPKPDSVTPKPTIKTKTVYVERCSNQHSSVTGDTQTSEVYADKIMLGEIENVHLSKEQLTFSARIDTGAVTSSIGVYSKVRFERDGKKWIRFTLEEGEQAPVYEYPLERTIRIVQQSSTDVSRRPVIKLRFRIGSKDYSAEFSLADRAHLEYQVLIGREFLRDIAVVDVSSKYLQGGN